MKNATAYEPKIRKFLGQLSPGAAPPPAPRCDNLDAVVEAVLQADASRKQARQALAAFHEEFVDYNELRVAPHKEIAECMGKDFPGARDKALELTGVLNALFEHGNELSLAYLEGMPKRELRRHLRELGLCPYAAACVALSVFGAHAVPVDAALAETLAMDGYAYPGSGVEDVQGFLERVISQKDARAAHEFLRSYVEKRSKALERKRRADRRVAQKAQALQEAARQQAQQDEQAQAREPARPGRAQTASRRTRGTAAAKDQGAGARKAAARPRKPRLRSAKTKRTSRKRKR